MDIGGIASGLSRKLNWGHLQTILLLQLCSRHRFLAIKTHHSPSDMFCCIYSFLRATVLWKRRHRIYNLCYMTSVCSTNQVSPSRHVPVPQVDWHLSQPLSGGRETNIGQQPIRRLVARLSLRHYVCPCAHPHRLSPQSCIQTVRTFVYMLYGGVT